MGTRENVERAIGGPLTDAQAAILTEFEVLDDPAGAATVGDALEMVRRFRDAWEDRHSEPRSRASRSVAERLTVVDRLHTIHARDELDALRSQLNLACMPAEQVIAMIEEVRRTRRRVEPPPLLPLAADEDLVSWIEERWAQEWSVTTLEDPDVLMRYMHSGGHVEGLTYLAGRTVRRCTVRSDGVLGKLAVGARKLAETWVWEEQDVVRWVLADGPPPRVVYARSKFQVRQVGAGRGFQTRKAGYLDTMSRIVLELDPELSPDDVATIYARARARGLAGERVRPLSAKALAMARLVLDHGPQEEWGDLLRRWNRGPARSHDRWCYQTTSVGRSNFIRDAKLALNRLQHRGWRP